MVSALVSGFSARGEKHKLDFSDSDFTSDKVSDYRRVLLEEVSKELECPIPESKSCDLNTSNLWEKGGGGEIETIQKVYGAATYGRGLQRHL